MNKYLMGGVVDKRVPNIDDLISDLGGEAPIFKGWLAQELGRYRFNKEYALPSANEEKRELLKYIKALKAAEHYLKTPFNLPPVVGSMLYEKHYKHGVPDTEETYRTILKMRLLAEQVEHEIAPLHSSRGRPSKLARNRLLSGIANRLEEAGATRTKSREIAEQILIRAKISVPSDERTLRRAHAKGGHK